MNTSELIQRLRAANDLEVENVDAIIYEPSGRAGDDAYASGRCRPWPAWSLS